MKPHHAFLRRCAALALALLLCFSLAACRESPVLHQVIYQQAAPETDEEEETLDPEDEGEEDERFDNEKDDEADTERDAEEDQGLEDESQATPEASYSAEVEYSPAAGENWQSQESPSGTAQGAEGSAENPEASPDMEQAENGTGEDGEETETTEIVPSGEENLRQIVDGSGRLVDLPESVETVTAVRWAAQMTEMLGGSGRLLAADSDFLSSSLAWAAFPDLGSVKSLWPGSGADGISDDAFASLLALEPDVCFEISGEHSFSSAQLQQLADAEIAYVVLPALNSADTLKQAVSLIAAVLGTNYDTGESASGIADAYAAWVDQVMGGAGGKVPDDCTSLYISQWDGAATYTLSHTKGVIESEGSGLAVAYSPLKAQLVSTFMKAAGVTNESTRIRSIHRDSEGVYVAPMFHQFDPVVSGRKASFYSGAGEYGSAYDLFVARMINDAMYYQLGGAQYPAIIVADGDVKAQIEGNWFWQYHESDGNGYVTISGESFYCGVIAPYSIFVNPQGMCDWAEGSVESPLESYWVAYKFGGGFTLDEVKEKTADFYRQFFGLELTESQLEEIFGE